MAKGNWVNDLNSGRSAEAQVASILHQEGFRVCDGPGTYVYDLAVGVPEGRCHLLEVKDESNYSSSVNLCVEIYSGNDQHPTGLYRTEASIQLHIFGEKCWLFKTQPMRNFLHDKLHENTYTIKGFRNGDSQVAGILVPKADLVDKPWAQEMLLTDLADSKLWRE